MMNMDQKLRNYAINDLKRFCDPVHYLFRDYDPEADRLLSQPLVQKFASLGLTPREFDAAAVLDAWATYQIRSRAILAKAYPAKDSSDRSAPPGTTEHQEIEMREMYRMYREAALAYAETLENRKLIEAFQQNLPSVSDGEKGEDRDRRIAERCNMLRSDGVNDWQKQVAGEENRSPSAIKQAIGRHNKRIGKSKPTAKSSGFSLAGQIKSASR